MVNPKQKPSLMEVIKEVLKKAKTPLSRADIAGQLKRPNKRLTPYDVQLLKKLVDAGVIEVSEREDGPVKRTNMYTYIKG